MPKPHMKRANQDTIAKVERIPNSPATGLAEVNKQLKEISKAIVELDRFTRELHAGLEFLGADCREEIRRLAVRIDRLGR